MHKKSLILILFILFLLLSSGSVLAKKIEVNYPSLPGVSPITEKSKIPDYIKYVFHFGMMIAGLVVLFVMITAGIQYVTSAGNPEKLNDAKKRIIGGILGLIILLSSYLILWNINPELIKLKEPDLLPMSGIYYEINFMGSPLMRLLSLFMPLTDASDLHKDGTATKLIYLCDEEQKKREKEIRAFFYDEEDFEGMVHERIIRCQGTPGTPDFYNITSSEKSVRFRYWRPGVAFYRDADCQLRDDAPPPYIHSSTDKHIYDTDIYFEYWWATFSTPNIKSIKIFQDINNPDPKKRFYIAILLFNQRWHVSQDKTLKGKTVFLYKPSGGNEPCINITDIGDDFDINYDDLSFEIIQFDKVRPPGAGYVADLFTEPLPQKGGYASVYMLDGQKVLQKNLSDIQINYAGISVPAQKQAMCQNFGGEDGKGTTLLKECLQSAILQKKSWEYSVFLFCDKKTTEINWSSGPYPNCEMFTMNDTIGVNPTDEKKEIPDFTPLWIRTTKGMWPKSLFIFRGEWYYISDPRYGYRLYDYLFW